MKKPARTQGKGLKSKAHAKLTARQKRFVLEYLKGRNASAAYKRAGYVAADHSAEATASRMLRNTEVSALVDELEGEHQIDLGWANGVAERARNATWR